MSGAALSASARQDLIRRFGNRPALLDTNVLLLLLCVEFDPLAVLNFKRLNSFRSEDFELLRELIQCFPSVRTTPHVWAEVSNLAHDDFLRRRPDWIEYFRSKIELISEESISTAQASRNPAFVLGVADAGLAELVRTHLIITIDWPLTGRLESMDLPVLNFNHLRSIAQI